MNNIVANNSENVTVASTEATNVEVNTHVPAPTEHVGTQPTINVEGDLRESNPTNVDLEKVKADDTESTKEEGKPEEAANPESDEVEKDEGSEDEKKEEGEVSEALDPAIEGVNVELGEDGYYKETGNAHIDYIVNTLKEANMSAADSTAMFGEAVANKDVSLVDKDALIEKVGADKAELILMKMAAANTESSAYVQEYNTAVDELSGGKFEEIKTWADSNLDQAQKDEYNGMIAQGGTPRKLAIEALKELAIPKTAKSEAPAELQVGDNVSTGASAEYSQDAFNKEMNALINPYTGQYKSSDGAEKMQVIRNRRMASRAKFNR